MEKRNRLQNKVSKLILKEDFAGIIKLSPRFGKSKTVIEAVKDKDWNISISCPRETIKESWKKEFEIWNYDKDISLYCNASLKNIEENLDLLIVDEIQTLSENNIRTIIEKKPKRILGVTGTLSEEKQYNFYNELGLKIIYDYSVDEAIEDGIISDFEINVLLCKLDDREKYIKGGTKLNPFLTTEKASYDYYTKRFNKLRNLAFYDKSYEIPKMNIVSKRRSLIYTSYSKLNLCINILKRIDRCLVFSGNIETVEKLTKYTYHSKNKKEGNLEKFKKEEINKLGVVGLVDMGITINNLKRIVIHQLQSNSEMSVQKILRACNLEENNRKAVIYILCYRDTVDEEWVKKALVDVNKEKINWTNIEDFNFNSIN